MTAREDAVSARRFADAFQAVGFSVWWTMRYVPVKHSMRASSERSARPRPRLAASRLKRSRQRR